MCSLTSDASDIEGSISASTRKRGTNLRVADRSGQGGGYLARLVLPRAKRNFAHTDGLPRGRPDVADAGETI